MVVKKNFETHQKKDLIKFTPGTCQKSMSRLIDKPVDSVNRKPKQFENKLKESTEKLNQSKLEDFKSKVVQETVDRRKRIDELRSRNNDRRSRVEERKRLICEAEREKREAILRKNQEAEARIEAMKNKAREEVKRKKMEREKKFVAFGTSTPGISCQCKNSVCPNCWSIAKDQDSKKKRTNFVTRSNKKANESTKSKDETMTTNSIRENRTSRRKISDSKTFESKSVCISSVKILSRSSSISSGKTTLGSESRSNSSMSQQSINLGSPVQSKMQPIAIVGNSISVTIQPIEQESSNSKVTSIKSSLSKLQSTTKIRSPISKDVKRRLDFGVTRAEEEVEEKEQDDSLMEETMRLANEMLQIEKQRLMIAIKETKRWEEEERRIQEKLRKKWEREETERKAKEEAERQRIEIIERLKKDEEERQARRKRVQVIMLRTRGENRFISTGEGLGRSR